MKPTERDELLVRMDEKFKRLYGVGDDDGDIPEIKRHLRDSNKTMLKNTIRGVKNETSIKWIVRIASGLLIIGGTATGLVIWLV